MKAKPFSLFLLLASLAVTQSTAQCPAGYSSASINWDNLDFLHRQNALYTASVTQAMAQTQNFALGTNRVTITTNTVASGAPIPMGPHVTLKYGDLSNHTGEMGAYGTGQDISFQKTGTGLSTITFSFLTEVQNLKFSVFDIDQEITFGVTATNASAVAQSITFTKPAGASSAIPLNGNASATTITSTTPLANWSTGGSSGTNYATTSNNGTINVDIAGPVKTVVLNFSNDGNTNDFWLSDLTACTADPDFPTNYYSTWLQPFTGQPSYIIANSENRHIYQINPATGVADLLFTEPDASSATEMNSLAYDPVNHLLYYVMSKSSSSGTNKALKKYDFSTGNISTVVSDITTIGVPTFVQGIEAASATFYNGCLYLGIDGQDAGVAAGNLESTVYRIEFDASLVPYRASQVFAQPADDGSGLVKHDWGDIIIDDVAGTLISHAGNQTVSGPMTSHYIHYNLQTGSATVYASTLSGVGGQQAQTWNGIKYRIREGISLYNNDGTIGSETTITTTSCTPSWSNMASDATFFKPKADFGDAPATYDPDPLSPALHEKNCNTSTLYIGALWDSEWSKYVSSDAKGDNTDTGGDDEDGVSTVQILVANNVSYNHVQQVTVFNNTGADATLGGWLDYNVDGVFDVSEGVIITVPSSSSPQTVGLIWNALTIPIGTPSTFLRIRLVSSANTLTVSNATGWYNDGEVEDYPVVSSPIALASTLISFTAKKISQQVLLEWEFHDEGDTEGFAIQRSGNGRDWQPIGYTPVHSSPVQSDYSFNDMHPLSGQSYYRLKISKDNNAVSYSGVRSVVFNPAEAATISPNPVLSTAVISYKADAAQLVNLVLREVTGKTIVNKKVAIVQGQNNIPLDFAGIKPGVYFLEIVGADKNSLANLKVVKAQ